jgi:hypothetical protein
MYDVLLSNNKLCTSQCQDRRAIQCRPRVGLGWDEFVIARVRVTWPLLAWADFRSLDGVLARFSGRLYQKSMVGSGLS